MYFCDFCSVVLCVYVYFVSMFVFHDFFPDPVVMVPCVFYIGKNGVPLEVSGGFVQPEELSNKLTNALQVST
jgi:xanthine/uracil permease